MGELDRELALADAGEALDGRGDGDVAGGQVRDDGGDVILTAGEVRRAVRNPIEGRRRGRDGWARPDFGPGVGRAYGGSPVLCLGL